MPNKFSFYSQNINNNNNNNDNNNNDNNNNNNNNNNKLGTSNSPYEKPRQ